METILKHSFCAHIFSFIIISEDRSQISANTKATLRVNASTRPSFDFLSIRTLLTSQSLFLPYRRKRTQKQKCLHRRLVGHRGTRSLRPLDVLHGILYNRRVVQQLRRKNSLNRRRMKRHGINKASPQGHLGPHNRM